MVHVHFLRKRKSEILQCSRINRRGINFAMTHTNTRTHAHTHSFKYNKSVNIHTTDEIPIFKRENVSHEHEDKRDHWGTCFTDINTS